MGLGRFEGRFRSCQDHFTWKIAVDKVMGMYNNASMASCPGLASYSRLLVLPKAARKQRLRMQVRN